MADLTREEIEALQSGSGDWPREASDRLATQLLATMKERDEARKCQRLAEEAEAEAKEAFWTVYPTYVRATGHGISEEAAHTELTLRVANAEAERDSLAAKLAEAEREMREAAKALERASSAAFLAIQYPHGYALPCRQQMEAAIAEIDLKLSLRLGELAKKLCEEAFHD